MANKPAFKNGVPLFKNGVLAFGDTGCTCCGCGTCTCASPAGTACSACPASCTPLHIEAVLSGIVPFCCANIFGSYSDSAGATLAGTFTCTSLAPAFPCIWHYDTETTTGSTFNFREFAAAGCGGAPTRQNAGWIIELIVRQSAGVTYVSASIAVSYTGHAQSITWFFGEVVMPCPCAGTVVINNGDGGKVPQCQTPAGTITLTFCP